jgi:neutral amino acid transport system ATP-binding protein
MSNILELTGVSRSFGGLRVTNCVSLTVADQGIAGLIGPNGAGKTTLFNIISGFVSPDEGQIVFRGESIGGLAPHEINRRGIGRTFQDPRVYSELTVLDNVIVGLRLRGEHAWWAAIRDRKTTTEWRAAKELSEAILDEVGLLGQANVQARDLAFGQQRFLSIARALVSNPRLILMDEPTVGLDRAALERFLELIARLASSRNVVFFMVEHNMDVIMSIASNITLLVQGSVAAAAAPQDLRTNSKMIEAYLGVADADAG